MARPRSLQLRLLVAFLGVAAAAIGAFALLTLRSADADVQALVTRQEQRVMADATRELADAYAAAGSWDGADVRAARAVARSGGAALEVRDGAGGLIQGPGRGVGRAGESGAATGTGAAPAAPGDAADAAAGATEVPVVVDGIIVGTARFRFGGSALPPAEEQLRAALTRTTAIGIVIAGLVALLVGIAVTGAITRPLRRLEAAARRLAGGDLSARAALAAPGELGELGDAFDRMAGSLQREDELRRAVTADVAHELRTPVTILRGQIEAMRDGVIEPGPDELASLDEEVGRLARLIEDLEALSSAEAAGLRLVREPVDLADVARSEIDALRPAYVAAGVRLSVAVDGPARTTGDARRLAQVVRNLLTNALAHTPAGGAVEVRVARRDGRVELAVEDTGDGIAADELALVFDRFYRGRGATTPGSGIGLAVVRELVVAHGGTVEAAQAAGGGALLRVALPA